MPESKKPSNFFGTCSTAARPAASTLRLPAALEPGNLCRPSEYGGSRVPRTRTTHENSTRWGAATVRLASTLEVRRRSPLPRARSRFCAGNGNESRPKRERRQSGRWQGHSPARPCSARRSRRRSGRTFRAPPTPKCEGYIARGGDIGAAQKIELRSNSLPRVREGGSGAANRPGTLLP